MVDDFVAALNTYDAEALRALATEAATLAGRDVSATGALGYDAVVAEWEAAGYTLQNVGEPIVVDTSGGFGDEFLVVQEREVDNPDGSELFRAVYAFFLVRQDGELLVLTEANLDGLR